MITEKYVNFIWDFDGTLFDSYPHSAAAMEKALSGRADKPSFETIIALQRISMGVAYERLKLSEEEMQDFRRYERDDSFEPTVKPYPGALDALERIHARGGRHFMFTHRDGKASAFLKAFGVEDLFECVVTAEDGFAWKPSPEAIEHIIEKYSLDKSKTVMIGDRAIDIGSGLNAGVHTLMFDEFMSGEAGGAEEIFTSFSQLD